MERTNLKTFLCLSKTNLGCPDKSPAFRLTRNLSYPKTKDNHKYLHSHTTQKPCNRNAQ